MSPEARLRAAILLGDGCRDVRRQLRLSGQGEPDWLAEIESLAAQLRYSVTGAEERRRALTRRRVQRWRARRRAEAA